jgi:hypothetical protein
MTNEFRDHFILLSVEKYSEIFSICRNNLKIYEMGKYCPRLSELGSFKIKGMWQSVIVRDLNKLQTKIPDEAIRAICHIVWGRPCYPGSGSLTLCEFDNTEGKITLSEDYGGRLEFNLKKSEIIYRTWYQAGE